MTQQRLPLGTDDEWRLDDRTRQAGRRGLAEAKAALAAATERRAAADRAAAARAERRAA